MTHTVSVEGLRFAYLRRGGARVEIDSLVFSSGVTVLVGPNGSGKSTLLKVLAGVLPVTHGTVSFDGEPLGSNGAGRHLRAPTAYLRQDFGLRGRTRVEEFLRYGAWMHGVPPSHLARRSEELLIEVGLAEVRATRVGRLSGGMQRRVGLGVELAHDPLLVLLDEPTSGLDHDAREQVHAVINRLVERGAIVVMSSHEEAEISRHDARVHVMRDGKIVTSRDHRGGDPVRMSDLLGEGPTP
ncbi:ABC transporter ATP-binding protein [Actinotalea sp. K2]|uniref:ABC transporter ATP-binding protein n=1 Tax=Actinotalea sp. K2 TaxID=2939438 RepID=UPI002016C6B6|nr:ABC transporter ATP-binding protein [Actinotalea sp. K2]MCL3860646.1 ABC transporter ATP-binding protein [Actinotalea sp. K2]